ncbi:hypothetical protein E1B28_003719 [Marasmius oreades]|uniref:Hydrophobin n=1 Tax=Marasmius oreades TaxID=181124 RepID=A0A9P7UX54_9AGAR|nr:uncharacterized protein E1B28_003719 [Marasmius oreades]KAG7096271.1 hypothetical protein E1B28_003719 [Marasmius oreades]
MLFNNFIALSALTTLAAAAALPGDRGRGSKGSDVKCCQQVRKASDSTAAGILSLLGVIVQDLDDFISLNCSPITVIGNGNSPCSNGGIAVTCTDISFSNCRLLGE